MDFSEILISWYRNNKRDLPWRKTTNPYKIWLSEIILQQTRVDQGLDYYIKFIKHYPTIKDLANAHEEEVLKLWQGLGYYSRARNLHFTAKIITNNHDGIFPNNYKDIISLKGIGEYTAAAISSFSFNLPYPVIDGNVFRVLSRVFNINTPIDSTLGKKEFKELAIHLIDKKNPAEYNQAIMEFGAIQCKPKNPLCDSCVFNSKCLAFHKNVIEKLPVKSKKVLQKPRYFNYLVIQDKNNIIIKQRTENDIWKGLYDFPLIESKNRINDFKNLDVSFHNNKDITILKSKEFLHVLSHQKIYATFWNINTTSLESFNKKDIVIKRSDLKKYPIPKLIENFIFKK